MSIFVARKLAGFIVTLTLASVIIFALMRIAGGDVVVLLLGEDAAPGAVERLREEFGLNRPLPVQYFEWITDLLRGDMGTSLFTRAEIGPAAVSRLPLTLSLGFSGLFVGMILGVAAGVYGAKNAGKPSGAAVSVLSQIGIATPNFWLGILLAIVFGVQLGWLPTGGWVPWSEDVVGAARSLILPTIALSTTLAAVLTRYVRTTVLDVLQEDYIRTARASGMTRRLALFKVGLRNASLPVITVLGIQAAGILSGTVIIETVFSLPGVGRMIITGVNNRDALIVQSLTMVLVAFVVFVNFVVDLMYGVLDPRVRRAR